VARRSTSRASESPRLSHVPDHKEERVTERVQTNERLVLRVEEAAAMLGISRNLAYELVGRGELPAVRLGRRIVVPRAAIETLLGGQRRP
jgi:excisionase family DNA binding protein